MLRNTSTADSNATSSGNTTQAADGSSSSSEAAAEAASTQGLKARTALLLGLALGLVALACITVLPNYFFPIPTLFPLFLLK